jgi:hypothetical protein
MTNKPEVRTTTQARAGVTPRIMRYVLVISLVLAVAAMVWVFVLAPAATKDGATTGADPVAAAAAGAAPAVNPSETAAP